MVSKKIVAGIAALLCAASVQATPIPLSTTVSLGNHLSYQFQDLQVNVNSALAGLSSSSIRSGTLTVFGYSSLDAVYLDDTEVEKLESFQFPYRYKNHITQKTSHYADFIADSMLVWAGDDFAFDVVEDVTNTYTAYGDRVADPHKNFNSGNGVYNYFYHQNRRHDWGMFGALEVTFDLGDEALGNLMLDGILDFTVGALGQFTLSGVRLDFTAQEQDASAPAAEIPAPTSLLLTGLGLAVLGGSRRRRKA